MNHPEFQSEGIYLVALCCIWIVHCYFDNYGNIYTFYQEEDEKEQLSQAKEASEDDGTEHAEAVEDSLLGLSIEEVSVSLL